MTSNLISDRQLQDLAQQIAEKFQPEKIILFGSYAYGEPDQDSDLDFLVIMNYLGRRIHQVLEIRKEVRGEIPIDIIVRSPDEIVWRYEQFDPLVRMAIDYGKELYARDNSRVA
ncbi:MAG: nucleotidyltransferase domain-containing protein [Oscillatoriales cyanobacterium SM2_2_1]|nr:nucleotidyltransferase domain-containing protein [Oscillatoriales cyanobacterium SM2_2_1]